MTAKTHLLLMAEFGTEEPLWVRGPEGKASGLVSLDCLPLTSGLKLKLRMWAKLHGDLNDPPFSSGTRDELEAFAKEGRDLLAELRAELGPTYDVQDRMGN
jgi:hypothetical protein